MKRKQTEYSEITFSKVKMCACLKILHFPTQILYNSQFDWSKAEVPLSELHLKWLNGIQKSCIRQSVKLFFSLFFL